VCQDVVCVQFRFHWASAVWLGGGGTVGALICVFGAAGEKNIGTAIKDVAYYDNPWELWAYDRGGHKRGSGRGNLSWNQ
jgi:hypothetical protein